MPGPSPGTSSSDSLLQLLYCWMNLSCCVSGSSPPEQGEPPISPLLDFDLGLLGEPPSSSVVLDCWTGCDLVSSAPLTSVFLLTCRGSSFSSFSFSDLLSSRSSLSGLLPRLLSWPPTSSDEDEVPCSRPPVLLVLLISGSWPTPRPPLRLGWLHGSR